MMLRFRKARKGYHESTFVPEDSLPFYVLFAALNFVIEIAAKSVEVRTRIRQRRAEYNG